MTKSQKRQNEQRFWLFHDIIKGYAFETLKYLASG